MNLSTIVELLKLIEISMRTLSDLLNNIVEFEEKYGGRTTDVLKESVVREYLLELIEKIPPEVFTNLVKTLLKISRLDNEFARINEMSPEEKRKISSELKSLADELSKVIDEITKYLT